MLENEGIEKINLEKDKEFAEKVASKYQQQPMIRLLRKRVANCRTVSYGFQLFSLLTLTYFVYWISSDYNGTYFTIVLSFLVFLSIAWEVAKRYTIIETFDGAWNPTRKWKMWFSPLVLLLVAGSITGSYIGGDQFMKNETTEPTLVSNPKIDSLRSTIAEELVTIEKLQNTTWKGRITRTANAGINLSKELQLQREAQLADLISKDDQFNTEILSNHTAKKAKLGFLTGLLAGLMDFLLLIMLGIAENMETQADKLIRASQGKPAPPQQQTSYQQIPSNATQQAAQQPISENKSRIGFHIPKNGFVSDQKRVTQADTQPDTEVTQKHETRVPRDTQTDTVLTRPQKDPDYIVKMIKRVRQRWARSFEGHSQAPKSQNTRETLKESALEEWRELEEMGYKIEKDTSLNPWGLLIVSPQKQ